MKKIIAFSLYGTAEMYVKGMRRNCELAPLVYPGWTVRIYGPQSSFSAMVYEWGKPPMFEWCPMPEPQTGSSEGMFWRFLAASDPDVSRVIFRDADSRLNAREAAAVKEWERADTAFHVMHDHGHHAGWRVLGGMWGCKGGIVMDMHRRISAWPSRTHKLDDMKFLASELWPIMQTSLTVHTSVELPPECCPREGTATAVRPFPGHSPSLSRFVGQVHSEDDTPDPTR